MEKTTLEQRRARWRGLGWTAQALCIYAYIQLLIVTPLGAALRAAIWEGADLSPLADQLPALILLLVLLGDFLIVCGAVLKDYCFARAETREKKSIADYLENDGARPLLKRLRREQVFLAGALLALFLLLGVYYLLIPLF
ncbi:MAG: hypothetical protein ACI4MR_03175 [Candidatus Aphodomorpha sp.]